MEYIFAPFNTSKNPGLLYTILVAIVVYFACIVNGCVVIACLDRLIGIEDVHLRTFVLACIQSAMFYVCSMFTFETELPIYILPEIPMSMTLTGKIGVFTAVGYGFLQFAGYATAGNILKTMGITNVNTLTNVAISINTYWFYWFGNIVIVCTWMWNFKFSGTAFAIFTMLIAFGSDGIVSFSSGIYVTGLIITGRPFETLIAGDTITQWAFWIYIATLGVPATVSVIYFFINGGFKVNQRVRRIKID